MNKTIILSLLKKLFPKGTKNVVLNMVDKTMTYTIADESKTETMDEKITGEQVALLKDYLNIRGQVLCVTIDLKLKKIEVKHTEGTKIV